MFDASDEEEEEVGCLFVVSAAAAEAPCPHEACVTP